jgi:integrase
MALRRVLLFLWEFHGAPKLDDAVPRMAGTRPRNVTATREEIEAIYEASSPSLRLWLMICSDLAIRSGTAATLAPHNYDPGRREFRFRTKYNAGQTLPVTDEICALIADCDMRDQTPFIWQIRRRQADKNHDHFTTGHISGLWRELRRVREKIGMTKRIIPHDLRRTTAVEVLRQTGDIRAVQTLLGHRNLRNTWWYVDHDGTPVSRSLLEIVKRPAWREEKPA